jgi:hypothetical protein
LCTSAARWAVPGNFGFDRKQRGQKTEHDAHCRQSRVPSQEAPLHIQQFTICSLSVEVRNRQPACRLRAIHAAEQVIRSFFPLSWQPGIWSQPARILTAGGVECHHRCLPEPRACLNDCPVWFRFVCRGEPPEP